MSLCDAQIEKQKIQYKLEPPDGGWGYVLTISMAVIFIVTIGPLAAFGIVYGKYLAIIGDEGSATSIIIGIFNIVNSFMGLVANHLLRNHSCRFIGIIGSISFFLGIFLTIFASSVVQISITFGVLQGIGFGLMISAIFFNFNTYFIKRKNSMMAISQTIFAVASMLMPYLSRFLMDEFGYRGTVAILAALSLHAFAAVITMQPVEWHMKKVPVTLDEMTFLVKKKIIENSETHSEDNAKQLPEKLSIEENKKSSILDQILKPIYKFLELSLLKDPSYVNIAVGIALTFMSDIFFISLLPMFINHIGYNNEETAHLMTIYLAADLFGRILLSVFTTLFNVRSRFLFLFGVVLTALIRIVFTLYSADCSWLVLVIMIVLLGMLRYTSKVVLPLVLAEYSETNFPAAFGLYSAICGIVSFFTGQLSSIIANNTTGDSGVQHLLTFQLLFCGVSWTVELIWNKMKK